MVAGFARALRLRGLDVPTGSVLTYTRALELVGLEQPGPVYWAGRATLVRRREDVGAYDRVFDLWWRGRTGAELREEVSPEVPLTLLVDDADADEQGSAEAAPPGDAVALRWSPVEVLAERDLASLTEEEWAEADRLISVLRVAGDLRRSRRTRTVRRPVGAGSRPDLRSTVRRSLRTAGVPMRRGWRSPVERPRRLVVVVDVSGSMEFYARGLLRFAHAAVGARHAGKVEVFTIGTRLTRITRELSRHDPDAALAAAAGAVGDWAGGTRLGQGLREFNDAWGARGLARGSVVVICSDGWDRGDPEVVSAQMARLSRVAARLVWVNPLKASPGYAPLARGMAAALPYVDEFVEGHSVASLEGLATVISGGPSR